MIKDRLIYSHIPQQEQKHKRHRQNQQQRNNKAKATTTKPNVARSDMVFPVLSLIPAQMSLTPPSLFTFRTSYAKVARRHAQYLTARTTADLYCPGFPGFKGGERTDCKHSRHHSWSTALGQSAFNQKIF